MTDLAPERVTLSVPDAASQTDARCRNCATPAPGAYCPHCGQETRITLPSARQFLKEAAGRYVSLDGRLWRTLAALLVRPGHLTREYLAGRRRRYVRPARLFLVLSIAMFALFRIAIDTPMLTDAELVKLDSNVQRAPVRSNGEAAAQTGPADTKTPSRGPSLTFDEHANLVVEGPPSAITDALRRRIDRFNALDREGKVDQVRLGVVRYGPYAMVVLLPVFALLLKVLYLGRARRYPLRPRRYAEHLVFAAHDLSFLFLIAMIAFVVPWRPVRLGLAAWAVAYSLLAMKAVYGGPWIGVLARAWCLAISYVVLFAFVVVGLLLTAVLLR